MDESPLTLALARILPILGLLTFLSATEAVIPLRDQSRNALGRLPTNLALTTTTLLLGIVFNALLLGGAVFLQSRQLGLLPFFEIQGVFAALIAVIVLDFSAYAAHVVMHRFAWLWRIHVVHHIDTAVDATTALRQHPLEGLVRFSFTAFFAWSLGAAPEAIALYRLLSSANAILEHANIRLPRWLEHALVVVWVTPNMHKMHHSRLRRETDSNYSNLFSFYDRLFGTYTSGERAAEVHYGIDGRDDRDSQSIREVLRSPF